MKRRDANRLARRKKNLRRRLARQGALRVSNYNLNYEIAGRVRGTSHGGVAALVELARATGLVKEMDRTVSVLKQQRPYSESDHILAIVAAVLAGGTCPEDLRRVRQDGEFLDSLGLRRLPDSTTAGDFLRRFEKSDVEDLMSAQLTTTERVLLNRLTPCERKLGIIDADGTITPTGGECMVGIDYAYTKRQWGYAPLLISLANTCQPLAIVNRPGNSVSHQDAAHYLDKVAQPMLHVFDRLLFRGDTDFSQTKHLDRWHESGRIDFVFGFDAYQWIVEIAQTLARKAWRQLKRPARYQIKTAPRQKPERIKGKLIEQRGFRNQRTVREDIAEFDYQPNACTRSYRMVVVRKQIEVTQGQLEFEPITRYFFYITNLTQVPAEEIVAQANRRCNQENLIAQLAGQVHALSTTSNTLNSNWAWMVIASLAWTLKSWFALFAGDSAERKRLLGMEFRTFLNDFIALPVQLVRSARRTILRILGGHLPSLPVFLKTWSDIRLTCRIQV